MTTKVYSSKYIFLLLLSPVLILCACSQMPSTSKKETKEVSTATVEPSRISAAHIYLYKKNSDGTTSITNRFKGTIKKSQSENSLPNEMILVKFKAYLPYTPKTQPTISSEKASLLDENKKVIAQDVAVNLQQTPDGHGSRMLNFELKTSQTAGNIYEKSAFLKIDMKLQDHDSGKTIHIKVDALPVK